MFTAKRLRVTALVIGLLAAQVTLAAGTAGSASASAPCGKTASDKDGGGWNMPGDGSNMRSGASTSCAITGVIGWWDTVDYHCWTQANDGWIWTYLRNDSDGTYGWAREDVLSDGGSEVFCGF